MLFPPTLSGKHLPLSPAGFKIVLIPVYCDLSGPTYVHMLGCDQNDAGLPPHHFRVNYAIPKVGHDGKLDSPEEIVNTLIRRAGIDPDQMSGPVFNCGLISTTSRLGANIANVYYAYLKNPTDDHRTGSNNKLPGKCLRISYDHDTCHIPESATKAIVDDSDLAYIRLAMQSFTDESERIDGVYETLFYETMF